MYTYELMYDMFECVAYFLCNKTYNVTIFTQFPTYIYICVCVFYCVYNLI